MVPLRYHCGHAGMLFAFFLTFAATVRAQAPLKEADLIGTWHGGTSMGVTEVTYAADHRYTMTFIGIVTGKATGTWRVEDEQLITKWTGGKLTLAGAKGTPADGSEHREKLIRLEGNYLNTQESGGSEVSHYQRGPLNGGDRSPEIDDRFGTMVNSKEDVLKLPASVTSIRARFLPDADFASLDHLPRLNNVSFSGYKAGPAKVSDAGLAILASLKLPDLRTVFFDHCDRVTDASLVDVGKLRSVTFLAFVACSGLTDAGLKTLADMPKLVELDLRGCENITDKGVAELGAKNDWQRIELGGCPHITPEAVAALQRKFPQAHIKKDDAEWEMEK